MGCLRMAKHSMYCHLEQFSRRVTDLRVGTDLMDINTQSPSKAVVQLKAGKAA